MKKLLLLVLVVLGGVENASAWGDMYLICGENNSWNVEAYGDNFKFVKVDDTHYRATVPGSYINNGNWNFRFREKSGDWWNIGPIGSGESDNTEVTGTAVQTNYKNSGNASFYISQNSAALFVQIFIEWADPYWKVTSSVITEKYTIAYANPDGWSTVYAYAYYNVDNCAEQKPLGAWSGSAMTFDNVSKVYTVDVPAISGGKVVFNDNGSNKYPSTNGFEIVANGVYGNSGLVTEVPVEITSVGYATFSSAYPLDFTNVSNVKAYRATLTGNETKTVLLTRVSGEVPAATGLLLSGDEGSYTIPTTICTTGIGDNLLVATVTSTPNNVAASTSGSYNYMLANGTNGVGFYYVDAAATSDAGKAYLHTNQPLKWEGDGDDPQVDPEPGEGNARVAWVFEDETQGINDVAREAMATDVVYDLQGRVVKNVGTGLYIMNGKKVIVK